MPDNSADSVASLLKRHSLAYVQVTPIAPDRFLKLSLEEGDEARDLPLVLARQLKPGYYGAGGYLEERKVYRSRLFNPGDAEPRTVHLGIDLWLGAGTVITVPLDGEVHSLANNDKGLDYGGTLILRHQLEGVVFHTLYGHLAWSSLSHLRRGDTLGAGAVAGVLGTPQENGGWEPHLHFQIIRDMEGKQGDYYGVAPASRLAWFSQNCPNPNLILRIPAIGNP